MSLPNHPSTTVPPQAIPTVPAHINGLELPLSSTFDVHSPSTSALLHRSSSATVADALSAVTAAQAAFPAWRDLPPGAKRDIFLKAASIFKSRAEELTKYMVDETGSDAGWAALNVNFVTDMLVDTAGRISSLKGDFPMTADPETSAIVYREPYGVILAIAPWNAPYILGIRAIALALAAGNTAILKAPELSPRCTWAISSCFHLAGLPPGVLNTFAHSTASAPAVTQALISDPRVRKINFTGSTAVGRIIAEAAGRALKPVLLELGGKAPAIVWSDCDVELAAAECAKGAFMNSGQICMSTERILVHKDIAGRFAERLGEKVREMFGVGVLVSRAGVEKNARLVADAVGKGAEVVVGKIGEEGGTRMAPIVVRGVTEAMELYSTESFGPSVSVIEVETEEEALRIANDTEYGLSAAVFTEDLRRGLRLARGIESGAVHINGMTVHDETALPHGGWKNSGNTVYLMSIHNGRKVKAVKPHEDDKRADQERAEEAQFERDLPDNPEEGGGC
ncbi:hypothetical protein V501_01902 [Pseudogymnoascus sp. VKM F-4519 (FW-2642)]|nr:hypothetical protein V500_03163 [Pseudogymnoascus sp. VKM F-4518 (FW-2643)]KFZ17111.1 hypothetical protein V501_01902 [Pseudogymnoascus sp. VKM F-4519 (FW-2642)]